MNTASLKKLTDELVKDMRTALPGHVAKKTLQHSVEVIRGLMDSNPLIKSLIGAVLFQEAEDVMAVLVQLLPELEEYEDNPYALKYVGLLQEGIRGTPLPETETITLS